MIWKAGTAIGALALIAALGACETGTAPPRQDAVTSPYEVRELKTLVAGLPVAAAFANEARFRATMEVLGEPCPDADRPGKCLADLQKQNADKGPAKLKGVGGAPGKAMVGSRVGPGKFAGIADIALNNNGSFNPNWLRTDFKVKGQIMETCEDGEDGYSFTWDQTLGNPGTLSLCVTTYTTIALGGGNTRTSAIQMRVKVTNAAWVDRKDTTKPDDVFPNAAAATGIQLDAIRAAGFGYKLYASGDDITITDIWFDATYNAGSPNFISYPRTAPAFAYMYETSPDACIDMMFQGSPPAALAPTDKPPFYCLGRCKAYPSLINTF